MPLRDNHGLKQPAVVHCLMSGKDQARERSRWPSCILGSFLGQGNRCTLRLAPPFSARGLVSGLAACSDILPSVVVAVEDVFKHGQHSAISAFSLLQSKPLITHCERNPTATTTTQFTRVFAILFTFGRWYHRNSLQPPSLISLVILAATSALANPVPVDSFSKEIADGDGTFARKPLCNGKRIPQQT